MAYYIFKNRGGKWKAIIIWTKLNMGTMRESDCFVTNYNYELVTDIERTISEFTMPEVNDVGMMDAEMDIDGSELANELTKGR